jgi:hypothetical protein
MIKKETLMLFVSGKTVILNVDYAEQKRSRKDGKW